jgi:Fic family protein
MVETPARIEPCLFEDGVPPALADLAVEIQRAASNLGRGLHSETAAELAELVRMMNCYYSNLIEGHNTRPRDIQRALDGAALEPETRPLALEAKAHVLVQRQIDDMHRRGALPVATSVDFIKWLHQAFYREMPDEFRTLDRADGTEMTIELGEFRSASDQDVSVGRHHPPSSDRVDAFMAHFEARFGAVENSASQSIIAIASAHHRLNFIHPFVDGNGRVSRLMSHAMGLRAGIGGMGLWSISRGLARGLKDRGEYKQMMDYADSPRRGDLDGRGSLSLAALRDFTEWFLSVALDQIRFSAILFDLDNLEDRLRALVRDVTTDRRAPDLISAVLKHGSLERGDAPLALKTSERTARNTLKDLVDKGFLQSDRPKASVRIAFPLDFRERLFPNLFADVEITPPEPPTLTTSARGIR